MLDLPRKQDKILRVKIVTIGDIESGKSCVIKRFCEKRFLSKYMSTIGIDYGVTRIDYNGWEVKINIFDMSGNVEFYHIRNEFYENTQAILLFFDVTDRNSFESLDNWLKEAKNEIDDINNASVIIIGNKVDKTRVVSEQEALKFCSRFKFPYFETSAKTGHGVNEIFQHIMKTLLERHLNNNENMVKDYGLLGSKPLYSDEQLRIIERIKTSRTNLQKLGLESGATAEEIKKTYRKLAILLHPDKSLAPGTAEAFDTLTNAKTQLLNN